MSDVKIRLSGEETVSQASRSAETALNNLNKTTDKMTESTERASSATKKHQFDIKDLAAVYYLAQKAIKLVADGITNLTQDFIALETSTFRLASAVRNNPLMTGSSLKSLNDYANQMQNVIRIDDAVIRDQVAFAANLGRTEEQIKKMTQAAADWAATGQITFDAAFQQLTRTYTGMAGTLSRYIGEVSTLTKEQLEMGAAVDLVAAKFKGLSEATGTTFEASLQRMNLAFGDTKELLGGLISVLAKPVIDFFTTILNQINAFLQSEEGWTKLTEVVTHVAGAFSFLYEIGKFLVEKVFNAITTALDPIVKAFEDLFKNIDENSPALIFFSNILQIIGLIITLIGQSTAQSIQLFINFINVMVNVGKSIGAFFQALVSGDWRIFIRAGNDAVKAVEKLGGDFLESTIGMLKEGFKTISNIAGNTFGRDLAKNIEDTMKTTATGMANLRKTMLGQVEVPGGRTPLTEVNITLNLSAEANQALADLDESIAGLTYGRFMLEQLGQLPSVQEKPPEILPEAAVDEFETTMNWINGAMSNSMMPMLQNLLSSLGVVGTIIAAVITFMSKFEEFSNIFTNFMDSLVSSMGDINAVFKPLADAMTGLGTVVGQILTPIFQFIAPIIKFVADLLGFVSRLLQPFTVFLTMILQALSPLFNILNALNPIITLLAQAFIILYNWAIMPLGNAIIFVIKVLNDIVAFFFNAISGLVAILTLGIVRMGTMAYSDYTTGWLTPISELTPVGPTGAAAEETAVYGGNVTQMRQPDIYIYQYFQAPVIGEGGMRQVGEFTIDAIQSAIDYGARPHFLEATPA